MELFRNHQLFNHFSPTNSRTFGPLQKSLTSMISLQERLCSCCIGDVLQFLQSVPNHRMRVAERKQALKALALQKYRIPVLVIRPHLVIWDLPCWYPHRSHLLCLLRLPCYLRGTEHCTCTPNTGTQHVSMYGVCAMLATSQGSHTELHENSL